MGDSPHRNSRYSESPRGRRYSRSRSPIRRENGTREDAINPGTNLYVAGLSMRVTEKVLEEYFSKEGKVIECRLVVDPRTRESRGFGFLTMETPEDADRCIKYLNHSTLEGRVIVVEQAKRRRPRTPTPGEYLGIRAAMRPRYRGYGGYSGDSYRSRRSPRQSPYYGGRERDWDRERSPHYSPYKGGSRRGGSRSPQYSPYR